MCRLARWENIKFRSNKIVPVDMIQSENITQTSLKQDSYYPIYYNSKIGDQVNVLEEAIANVFALEGLSQPLLALSFLNYLYNSSHKLVQRRGIHVKFPIGRAGRDKPLILFAVSGGINVEFTPHLNYNNYSDTCNNDVDVDEHEDEV